MTSDSLLTEPRFTMGDLATALGERERSGTTRLLLARLREFGLDCYTDLADPAAPEETTTAEEDGTEDTAKRRGWQRFSLLDCCWVSLMRDVEAIGSLSALEFASLGARFRARELARDGSITRKAGLKLAEDGGRRPPTFGEYVQRMLEGVSEPFLAIVIGTAGKMNIHERTSAGIPEDVVISDNPDLAYRLFTRVALALVGHLHVFPFRTAVALVMRNLRPRPAGAIGLPEMPPYRQRELQDVKVTAAERQFLELVRDTPALVPNVSVRIVDQAIESINFEQTYGPKGFNPSKPMEDPKTVQIRSIRDQDGSVRKYVVEKRLTF